MPNEKKNKERSWAYKVFVRNIEIKIMAIVLAFITAVIMNIK